MRRELVHRDDHRIVVVRVESDTSQVVHRLREGTIRLIRQAEEYARKGGTVVVRRYFRFWEEP